MTVTTNAFATTQSINNGVALCTAAKTTYNDTTNAVLLFTAGANGSLVYDISAIPRATVTATQLQLYSSTDAGVTLDLLRTELMAAYTMATTTKADETAFEWTEANPLRLKANERLYCGAAVALAGGIKFHARGEDF